MNVIQKTVVDEVLALEDFSPSDETDALIARLVDEIILSDLEGMPLTSDPKVLRQLRIISSETEAARERLWAHRLLEASSLRAVLAQFPYRDNYEKVVNRELALVAKTGRTIGANDQVLMVGSGALPMTAYEIVRQSGATVDHVDNSKQAIVLCEKVSERLHLTARYYEGDGQTIALNSTYDLIIVAALAGSSIEEKQAIIDNIVPYVADGGRIVVRSACGNRAILYPDIDPSQLKGVTLLSKYFPSDHTMTCIYVYGVQR